VLLGLGLLQLTLGRQRVVPRHCADDFLRLALDRIDQNLRAWSALSCSVMNSPNEGGQLTVRRTRRFLKGSDGSETVGFADPLRELASRALST
jgi:hypothetical protein